MDNKLKVFYCESCDLFKIQDKVLFKIHFFFKVQETPFMLFDGMVKCNLDNFSNYSYCGHHKMDIFCPNPIMSFMGRNGLVPAVTHGRYEKV